MCSNMRAVILVILGVVALANASPQNTTSNVYQVFRVNAKNVDQAEALLKLREETDVDFWTEISMVLPTDIMVKPEDIPAFHQIMETYKIDYDVMVPDVQMLLNQQSYRSDNSSNVFNWKEYQTLDQINKWLDDQKTKHEKTPKIMAKIINLGKTTELNDLRVFVIGIGKQKVWIDGGIHAREWLSPPTVTYMIEQLLTNGKLIHLLETYEWHFLPVQNPDGYKYTFINPEDIKYRMWRKTRKVPTEGGCVGVDANRNWPFQWNTGGSSPNKCNQAYHGPKENSEPEVSLVTAYMPQHRFRVAITIHAYSQLWMLPWAYTEKLPADYYELLRVGRNAARALRRVHGKIFRVGNIHDVIYKASGSSTDWMKEKGGAKYAYALELRPGRDYPKNGFIQPPSEIILAAAETWAGVLAVVNDAKVKSGN